MIQAKEIIEQLIRRLVAMNFFPPTEEAQLDLVNALRTAKTAAIAVWVVDEWIASNRECPKPADLYQAIAAENERGEESEAIRDIEQWKREAAHPIQRMVGGIFALGRDPLADRHLEVLRLRIEEIGKHGRHETELARELRAMTSELRAAR